MTGPEAIPTTAASLEPASNVSVQASAVTDLFSGYSADFETLPTTEAIEDTSEVVVIGTIEDVQNGPSFGRADDDLGDITTMVVKIGNLSIASGELSSSSTDGFLYLNMIAPYSADRSEFLEAFPVGTEIVSYALPYEGPGSFDVIGESSGRPAGQQMYLPSHPQGLAVKTGGSSAARGGASEIVWPLTGAVEATELTEALPGGSAIGASPDEH